MLTAAQINFFGFSDFYLDGPERRAFVAAITKRLISTAAARTPPVSARFQGKAVRLFTRDLRRFHPYKYTALEGAVSL